MNGALRPATRPRTRPYRPARLTDRQPRRRSAPSQLLLHDGRNSKARRDSQPPRRHAGVRDYRWEPWMSTCRRLEPWLRSSLSAGSSRRSGRASPTDRSQRQRLATSRTRNWPLSHEQTRSRPTTLQSSIISRGERSGRRRTPARSIPSASGCGGLATDRSWNGGSSTAVRCHDVRCQVGRTCDEGARAATGRERR
jgi:hypothetical protein